MATTTDVSSGANPRALDVQKTTVVTYKGATDLQGGIAADTFQIIKFEKNVLILGAVLATPTYEETATVLTVDIGVGAGDTIMDGVDLITSAADGKAYLFPGTNGTAFPKLIEATAAAPETVDITIKTVTGVITEIVYDVYLVVAELE